MEVAARAATGADLSEVSALQAAAVEEARPKRGGAVLVAEAPAKPSPGLSEFTVVGTIDDTIVGYLRLVPVVLENELRVGRITDLFVLPDARRVGVGEALVEVVLASADDLGIDALDSVALPGDRDTKNFFETHGLVARAITVHRSLRP